MTALAADRQVSRYGADSMPDDLKVPVAASTTIYRGALVAINRSGYAVPASADLALVCVGVAREKVVGTTAGAKSVSVERGAFAFENSSGDDAITSVDVGRSCFVADDQTAARTSANGTRPYMGRVLRVESSKVFVEVGTSEDPRVVDMLFEANGDLSSSQYLFVEMDSNGDVGVCNAAGEAACGVLQNAPASGAIAIVRMHGPSRVIGGGTVAIGSPVATTSAGKSKVAVAATVNTSDAGGASDPVVASHVMGFALTLGAADTQHSIFVHPMGAIPATAA